VNLKKFLKAALGAGLFLLDQSDHAKKSIREKVSDQFDDLRDRAQETYEAAADRVARVSEALHSTDDNSAIWNVLRFATGLGIGIGVGLVLAPAKGEVTRAKLAEKAQEFGGNVRQRFAPNNLRAAGD
jgi:gas vesicle protein